MSNPTQSSSDVAMHVSYVSIVINLMLSTFKFLAGIFGHSAAMISDGHPLRFRCVQYHHRDFPGWCLSSRGLR